MVRGASGPTGHLSYQVGLQGEADEIMRDHLAISQFAPGQRVQRWFFPVRNRTMALVSDATVIVEASDTSGSLSQGWEAIRLGRLLFVTKSVMEDGSVTWPRKMMDYGAQILSDETLEAFVLELPDRSDLSIPDELAA